MLPAVLAPLLGHELSSSGPFVAQVAKARLPGLLLRLGRPSRSFCGSLHKAYSQPSCTTSSTKGSQTISTTRRLSDAREVLKPRPLSMLTRAGPYSALPEMSRVTAGPGTECWLYHPPPPPSLNMLVGRRRLTERSVTYNNRRGFSGRNFFTVLRSTSRLGVVLGLG